MMMLQTNLISTSPLIQDTVELLRTHGTPLHSTVIAHTVLQLRNVSHDIAAPIISTLIAEDQRLQWHDDFHIELREEDAALRKLSETDYVVLDVETTGAKAPPSRITEVGAYRIRNGKITDEFQSLVNPLMPIPYFIAQLTGISDAMVRDAPVFAEIAPDLLNFIGDSIIVAHNSHFDIGFLNYEFGRIFPNRQLANLHLCTVRLARRVFPGLENYKLHTVADYFAIPIFGRHRAAGDARATAEIFIHILETLREHDVADISTAQKFKIASNFHG